MRLDDCRGLALWFVFIHHIGAAGDEVACARWHEDDGRHARGRLYPRGRGHRMVSGQGPDHRERDTTRGPR
ncbi:hypothetical protein [Bradyrhizobium japonicum]|uniref:hypothetical protein n=1 Tax=Bradyrhizobium TaxID=374 RepID=UPI001BAADAD5|nr:hypothetical protein [Bradyrhizobium liaoningense]MBR0943543.1 hypothetical protein [Bradyrhizobium liaoningense]MBR1001302.1 hypothetical protein [Bradyrhizobium liaoningense]MBR1031185.1 hypothetical protein [Bradyrhizobium liaoningense]MBR1066190.1 hypothetical protein [Bradyrhizobium liaoningense]